VQQVSTCLIPRSFPPPVFNHLQYANTEGVGLGELDMCGDVRKTEGRHILAVIVPILCPAVPGILNNKRIGRLPCEHSVLQPSYGHYKKGFKIVHPCVSTLCHLTSLYVTISQVFLLCICIPQANEDWR